MRTAKKVARSPVYRISMEDKNMNALSLRGLIMALAVAVCFGANFVRAADLAYTVPNSDPLYPSPPYIYKGNRGLLIIFKSDPEVLKKLVPAPLIPNPDGTVVMWFGEYKVAQPFVLPYVECGMSITSTLNGKSVEYSINLYLDDDAAITAGREIWGWPKKHAIMSYQQTSGKVVATAKRKGVEIIRVTFEATGDLPIKPAEPLMLANLKTIPSVRAGAKPDVQQITGTPYSETVRVLKGGKATLQLRSSPDDPLGNIPVKEILDAMYSEYDNVLPLG
jgi:acetoacetate decarboxylase